MKAWTKKDFEIKGRRTGSQLRGRENEYVYEIFYNGNKLSDRKFYSKARANQWLAEFLKKANAIRANT